MGDSIWKQKVLKTFQKRDLESILGFISWSSKEPVSQFCHWFPHFALLLDQNNFNGTQGRGGGWELLVGGGGVLIF